MVLKMALFRWRGKTTVMNNDVDCLNETIPMMYYDAHRVFNIWAQLAVHS
jgi:hypothetical protein